MQRKTGVASTAIAIATDWHTVLITICVALYVAYRAAYPYLNPSNVDWQNAVIQAVLAVVGLLVYGHGVVSTKRQIESLKTIDSLPTRQMPAQHGMPRDGSPYSGNPNG